MERVDAAVVGAGVVGLAAAARLARADRSVVVLESESRYGTATSSRNSEVLHAGIYYPPASLKSRLCHEGRRVIYALAERNGLFARKIGKYIVATDADEEARLAEILSGAQAAGAEGLSLVDGAALRKSLPFVRARAAIWSPESGIVDSEDLMRHFYARAQDGGAIFLFGSPLSAVERAEGGFVLVFGPRAERLWTPKVVNAAGLFGDRVAALAGMDVDAAGVRIHWCKGQYFRYNGQEELPHLVYPVPQKHSLGIHLTPDRQGKIRLGPDAAFVEAVDYAVPPERAETFRAAAARYWPKLAPGSLSPDTAGIRPKLCGPEGGFRDFYIQEESSRGLPGWVNALGIESPGLTASPAIAERVAALLGL